MGSRIVRQPNGLFARFSEIVYHFTHMNLTQDDVRAICLDNGCTKDEAEGKLVRAIHDLKPYSMTEGSGLDRWNHCLSIIEGVHGKEAVEEVKEIGEHV